MTSNGAIGRPFFGGFTLPLNVSRSDSGLRRIQAVCSFRLISESFFAVFSIESNRGLMLFQFGRVELEVVGRKWIVFR